MCYTHVAVLCYTYVAVLDRDLFPEVNPSSCAIASTKGSTAYISDASMKCV